MSDEPTTADTIREHLMESGPFARLPKPARRDDT